MQAAMPAVHLSVHRAEDRRAIRYKKRRRDVGESNLHLHEHAELHLPVYLAVVVVRHRQILLRSRRQHIALAWRKYVASINDVTCPGGRGKKFCAGSDAT